MVIRIVLSDEEAAGILVALLRREDWPPVLLELRERIQAALDEGVVRE